MIKSDEPWCFYPENFAEYSITENYGKLLYGNAVRSLFWPNQIKTVKIHIYQCFPQNKQNAGLL